MLTPWSVQMYTEKNPHHWWVMIFWHPELFSTKRQYCRGGLFVPLFLFFLHPIKRPSVSCHLKHWNILKLPGPNKHDIFIFWNLETAKKTIIDWYCPQDVWRCWVMKIRRFEIALGFGTKCYMLCRCVFFPCLFQESVVVADNEWNTAAG